MLLLLFGKLAKGIDNDPVVPSSTNDCLVVVVVGVVVNKRWLHNNQPTNHMAKKFDVIWVHFLHNIWSGFLHIRSPLKSPEIAVLLI
jgi:hypothetical protein